MAYATLTGGSDYLAKYIEGLDGVLRAEAEAAADMHVTEHFARDWPIETWHDDTPPMIARIALLVGSAEYIRRKHAKHSAVENPPKVIKQYMDEADTLTKAALGRGELRDGYGETIKARGQGGGLTFPMAR